VIQAPKGADALRIFIRKGWDDSRAISQYHFLSASASLQEFFSMVRNQRRFAPEVSADAEVSPPSFRFGAFFVRGSAFSFVPDFYAGKFL
jgi:hypothetical protein